MTAIAMIKRLILPAFCVVLLGGCSSSSIVTNKSEEMRGPYHKMFIVLTTDVHTVPFTKPWLENVKDAFVQRGIETDSYTITSNKQKNDLSLDSEDESEKVNAAINTFQPESVLIVNLRKIEAYSGVQIGGPGSNGATFDVKLFNSDAQKTPVWRASFKVFANYGISLAVENGTKKFIGKLEDDNVIAHLNKTASN